MEDIIKEGFKIVIGTHDDEDRYDYEKGEYRHEYLEEIKLALSDLGALEDQVEFDEADIGVGASVEAIVVIILALFFTGKSINENIDAWVKLAKRLKGVLKKLKTRGNEGEDILYISYPFAVALAIGVIIESKPNAQQINLEISSTEVIPNGSIDAELQNEFKYNQRRYYIFTFRVIDEGETLHVICIHSRGHIEFHHVLNVTDWMEFEGFKLTE